MTSPVRRPNHGLSWLAVIGFSCVSAFQVCLAAGVPWGQAAWGGGSRTLEGSLRVQSAVAACLMAAGAAVAISALRGKRRPVLLRVAAVVTGLSALANVASTSPWERFGWAPVAATLSVLCLVLARRPAPPERPLDEIASPSGSCEVPPQPGAAVAHGEGHAIAG
jgi:peptidoglycan/LPS O-acetylase OafA/YrhL